MVCPIHFRTILWSRSAAIMSEQNPLEWECSDQVIKQCLQVMQAGIMLMPPDSSMAVCKTGCSNQQRITLLWYSPRMTSGEKGIFRPQQERLVHAC